MNNAELRKRWTEIKNQLDEGKIKEIKAIMANVGLNFSVYSYYFTAMQIKAQGLTGIPYVDYKTYNGWKNNGFQVKRGEKSTISGITWVTPMKKDSQGNEEESDYSFPKEYHLFGRHQVEARAEKSAALEAVAA